MSWQTIAALCVLCFTVGMVFAWALDAIDAAHATKEGDRHG